MKAAQIDPPAHRHSDAAQDRTDCGRYPRSRLMRPSWAEIDLSAIRHNVMISRRVLGKGVKLYFVCKCDGYGLGSATAARLALDAGADGLCVGSPEEVECLRDARIKAPTLLFGSPLPQDLDAMAAMGARLTVHSMETLAAVVALSRKVEVHVEIDSGFGRFGLREAQWGAAFARLREATHVRLVGVYSHLSSPDDPEVTSRQAATFNQAIECARSIGYSDLEVMLASSRVVVDYPDLHYNAVDPGRLIYGALDSARNAQHGLRPVLRAIKARIIHVQDIAAGEELGIGYAAPIRVDRAMRTAVVPIGFWDGLNQAPEHAEMLVLGQRTRVLGRRSAQHSLIDVTGIPGAEVGAEVVVLGRQGNQEVTMEQLAAPPGTAPIEMYLRLVRLLPHMHLHEQSGSMT
jgi:alanine racemase